ncbi:putative reverse transcriptase domain-containing protein [Tanacetum coccineum]|uniref:Reverse transcriptase domain-containing protein n=1 Tax=Tanacetum coccineum TaxID=301880 RepID=A0ABQ5HSZ0_9ASTR
MKCQPLGFKGIEGVVGLIRWTEKIEIVFHISNCPERYQVKYATCSLLDSALTWWNSHKRTIGTNAAYALSWRELLKLMTEVYCPRNEIQKMETELWNLSVKNNDMATYTQRFQELTMMCTKMVPEEEDWVEKFIGGLPDNIQGNNTGGQNVTRAYMAGNNEKNGYDGTLPFCNKSYVDLYLLKEIQGRIRELLRVLSVVHKDITGRIVPKSRTKTLAVELADRRTSETKTVLRGCTLGLLGHPLNIDLIPIDLGSFDVIIGMDWLAKNHAVIVCDKNIVRIPYGNKILIVKGDKSDKERNQR